MISNTVRPGSKNNVLFLTTNLLDCWLFLYILLSPWAYENSVPLSESNDKRRRRRTKSVRRDCSDLRKFVFATISMFQIVVGKTAIWCELINIDFNTIFVMNFIFYFIYLYLFEYNTRIMTITRCLPYFSNYLYSAA